jgi:1D-myo-inositol 3-kinase
VPRLLAVGHVTRDVVPGGHRLGGSAAYASLAARRLGWSTAAATAAGPDFEPERELPGIEVFARRSPVTTRFQNTYGPDGHRRQLLLARADDIDPAIVPAIWKAPDALLLAPVAAEVMPGTVRVFSARFVGACGQGWLRAVDPATHTVSRRDWPDPAADLAGVDVVFLSYEDVDGDAARAHSLLALVPLVVLTRGRQGAEIHTAAGVVPVPGLPRDEVDPTGAGDVFAAAFLIGYCETPEPVAAAAFACCAASCVVEAEGTLGLGDRAEVERRLALRAGAGPAQGPS